MLTTVKDPILGFIDECSLQQRPNARRVLNTHIINYQPGSVRSKTIFGFMALNGNDEVMISSSSKADDMITFIKKIRIRNAMSPICILLDNAKIHIAEKVRILAREIDIHFIYNIPYSPDLNPIEFGWKDFKREISKYTYFNEAIVKSHDSALNIFYCRKDGYSKSWMDKFLV